MVHDRGAGTRNFAVMMGSPVGVNTFPPWSASPDISLPIMVVDWVGLLPCGPFVLTKKLGPLAVSEHPPTWVIVQAGVPGRLGRRAAAGSDRGSPADIIDRLPLF